MNCSTSGSQSTMKPKPANIWSSNRQIKKSCVVTDLASLKTKGCEKLGLEDDQSVRVVLESDGTEIDENSYFQLLDDFSTFIFLTGREQWTPPCSSKMLSEILGRRNSQGSGGYDSSDATDGVISNSGDCRAEQLFDQLCTEGAYKQLLPWLLMRPFDLEEIVNADPSTLYLKYNRQVVDEIQEMSSKALNDYNSAQKAVELLNLYDQAASRRKVP